MTEEGSKRKPNHYKWTKEDAAEVHRRVQEANELGHDMGGLWICMADEYGKSANYLRDLYRNKLLPLLGQGKEAPKRSASGSALVDALSELKDERDFYKAEYERLMAERKAMLEILGVKEDKTAV